MTQKRINRGDTVLDLGCGLMLDIMDFCPTYPKSKLHCKELIGVDAYKPYLDWLNGKGIKTVHHDLRELPLPFPDKGFDVVLMLDVLEHLDSVEQATKLVNEAKRVARKTIFVVTPRHYDPKTYNPFHAETKEPFSPYYNFGLDNKLQHHHFAVTEGWFKPNGFRLIPIARRKTNSEHFFAVYGENYLDSGLKILHCWDQAGVNCLMALYQRELGHQADIIMRKEFDSHCYFYGFSEKIMELLPAPEGSASKRIYLHFPEFTKGIIRYFRKKSMALKFYLRVLRDAKDYDVLHVNSVWMVCLLLPFKKKILEFHGDDMRKSPTFVNPVSRFIVRAFIRFYSLFNPVYVSTEDLLDEGLPNLIWIPNPVDTLIFKLRKGFEPNTALYSAMWYEDEAPIVKLAEERGWKLTIHRRKDNAWIPYEKMPDFLRGYEYYIDRYAIHSLSKTALECLAMGLKVVRWDGAILEGLPSEHEPLKVAQNTLEIYNKTLGRKVE